MNQRVAIFGDIHGNLPALQAVLADMQQRGQDVRYCLGDLVGYGTSPDQVVALIREQGIPTIMGNYDQGVGNDSDDCGCAYTTDQARKWGEASIAWTNAHTSSENKAFLRALPDRIALQLGDLRVLLTHGSPRKINEYLYADRTDESLQRILNATDADVLVCGHTHLPYHRTLPDGRQVINAGSVGKPKDNNPHACYVLLGAQGKTLTVEFVRVPYDIEQAAKAIEMADGMPDVFAQMLRDGRG